MSGLFLTEALHSGSNGMQSKSAWLHIRLLIEHSIQPPAASSCEA